MATKLDSLSWPAKAGHPDGEELNWRVDTRLLDGPVKQGHDNGGLLRHSTGEIR